VVLYSASSIPEGFVAGPVDRVAWVAAATCALMAMPAFAQTPDERFQEAENTFRFQDYPRAETLLADLLYPEVLLTAPDRVIKAHEYLAACYYWLQNDRRMEEEFTVLLSLAPRHQMDPFYYPARLIERLEATRKRLAELRLIDPDAPEQPATPPEPPCEGREVSIVRRSWAPNLVPFGVGQFVNGQTTKGALFLTGQVLTLGMNIGAFAGIESLRGDDGLFSPADAVTARRLRIVQYVGLGAFGALAIWGIVDAFLNFQAEDRTIRVVPCPVLEGPNASLDGFAVCVNWR
jgi:hypothetical protein